MESRIFVRAQLEETWPHILKIHGIGALGARWLAARYREVFGEELAPVPVSKSASMVAVAAEIESLAGRLKRAALKAEAGDS